jgi:hypothetical protein
MKKINWLDHIASLLVVILGISIAFYLESYKEQKANDGLEKKYLQSLIKDLETDITALDTLQSINKLISNALVKLSDATTNPEAPRDSIAGFMLGIQYNPPFSAQKTTYESLKSSGQLELISNFELRNEIVELYEQYYWGTSEYDISLLNHINDFLKPFYMSNVYYTGRFQVNEDFLDSNVFRNIIYSYRYLFQAKMNFYDQVNEQTQQTLEKLKKYMETEI